MNRKPASVVQPDDWTWLLKVPVAAGEPMPMELWFLYHANTLLPMRKWAKYNEQLAELPNERL